MSQLRGGRRASSGGRPGSNRSREPERGALAVEFGIIAPLLILLVLGIIDFGWMINRESLVNNVSRDAVRVASLDGSYADIDDAITSGLVAYGIPMDKVDYSITCVNPSGPSCDGSAASYASNAAPGSRVVVSIEYAHDFMTPVGAVCNLFGGDCGGNVRVLSKTAEMVRE